MTTPRIYLTGEVAVERGDRLLGEADLPGRQGKLAFVFLVLNRFRPVGRPELIEAIWSAEPPPEADAALSAILSKLRRALKPVHLDLKLPVDTWIDVEIAANAIDEADGALRRGDAAQAWSHANVAVSIARRPLLTDHEAPWIETRRASLRALLVRGLESLAAASGAAGQPTLAVEYMSEVIDLEPFRETAYQRLMQLQASLGNRGEALRVFERCRQLMRGELGANPSPRTEAVFLEILREEG